MGRVVWVAVAMLLAAAPGASASTERSRGLVKALTALDAKLSGSRSAVHRAKADLMAAYYEGMDGEVLSGLDCVATELQKARNGGARTHTAAAKRCFTVLKAAVPASAELTRLGRALDAIAARARAKRVFGSMATAWRKAAIAYVKRRHNRTTEGVGLGEAYADLECIDVKVEAGRASGASSCLHRLRRLVEDNAPDSPLVTFGSDLTGDPVAIAGTYPEDTEFWTKGVAVPADGMLTQFKLRIGSDPIDLPLRFSVVRPQPDGQVKVVTTTDPPYSLPGKSPGTYTFKTSALSFTCCRVQKGDIVTADNSGAGQTKDPYVWFAAKAGFTTFSHTCSPCGLSQNPGMLWTGTPHENFELLLQVVIQPE